MTYTYYRYETGIWYLANKFNHVVIPCEDIRQIPSNFKFVTERRWDKIPEYNIIQYFHPVNMHSVFSTFCIGITSNTTRLVFRTEWGTEFNNWRIFNNLRKGDYYTRITITTENPLPLAEDFISEYVWTNERGIEVKGCPWYKMELQHAINREYVIQPDDIVSIQLQHYQI